MPVYNYDRCLKNSHKVNWRIDEVLAGHAFDPSLRWLPSTLSGADQVPFLDEAERRKLTHIEMASYAHLFGYVEEFIAPKVAELSVALEGKERDAFDALTNFAAEEVKHMRLFREIRDRINATLGFDLQLVDGEQETAEYVLTKSTAGVVLFTACIEWLTQRHYLDAFRTTENLDPFTKHIFKSHWQEEAQHAQLDHLETLRAFEPLSPAQREEAIDDLIELVGAVDGLLQKQSRFDAQNFEAYAGRSLSELERDELYAHILRAKRQTFVASGVTHPRFQELFVEVSTPAQQDRVGNALMGISEALCALAA